MQGNFLVFLSVLIPMIGAPICYLQGKKQGRNALLSMFAVVVVDALLLLWMFVSATQGVEQTFGAPQLICLGLSFRADGFRALYGLLAGIAWLVSSLVSIDDFASDAKNMGRYAFFTLLTFGATLGVFLADTLYTVFVFFEMMSLMSYPWVAHYETAETKKAAQTYLYLSVGGGLCMLMGMFLLPTEALLSPLSEINVAIANVSSQSLMIPSLLVLSGFLIKAGGVPLHIWLPRSYCAAPAPATALLSSILSKAGIYGIIVLTVGVMNGYHAFGNLILFVGVITMVLGGILGILSVDAKRTLACSSLSQVGFLLVGAGLLGLLGEHNAFAAYGLVGHMVNHTLFKLILFLVVGVVLTGAGKTALNEIRGFGRNKFVLHFCFFLCMVGVAGIPLFSGYLSKSLLHEAFLELITEMSHEGVNTFAYSVGELAFIISGGMTLCYMLKVYICLFWQKHPTKQAQFDQTPLKLSLASKIVLCALALCVLIIGVFPGATMTVMGDMSLSFVHGHEVHGAIEYFCEENLLGACKSIAIGLGLYVLVRFLLMKKAEDGSREYINVLPEKVDLEYLVYRPLLRLVGWLLGSFAEGLHRLMDVVIAVLKVTGTLIALILSNSMDVVILVLKGIGTMIAQLMNGATDNTLVASKKTVFKPTHEAEVVPVGNRFTYVIGRMMDGVLSLLNRSIFKDNPVDLSFVTLLAAGKEEVYAEFRMVTKSSSFGLLLFCFGLFATLVYLIF